MRIWADNVGNPGMLLYNATTSVERILGIRAYGRGGCRAWVLDLVEAGVEQLERDRVLVGGA